MSIPRPEYPRPQFMRASWENLNGPWEFAFDYGDSGEPRGMFRADAEYPETILVPFCPESKLSGIGHTDFMAAVWYRKTVTLTPEQCEGRVFLRFGAVDYLATVYVNGKKLGRHRGGYASFGVEITVAVQPGENTLVVQAQDSTRGAGQPGGKQCPDYHSRACHYTRTTGIWQTVWLEFVPKAYIRDVKIVPDDISGLVTFDAAIDGLRSTADFTVKVSYEGKTIGETTVPAVAASTIAQVRVPEPVLWMPGKPALYDVEYTLRTGCGVADTVSAYFGFRRSEIEGNRFLINGKKIFQRLVLDQGFYPDGIYTAPTDEDLKRDIELSMEAGFNGARLHQKVFEERFLYWADRLGYIVWGEHASWGLDINTSDALAAFAPEWVEIVMRDRNHPSIVGWCPLNETPNTQERRTLEALYKMTRAIDSTRPCIDTSGYCHVITDVYDVHDYEQDPKLFRETYECLDGKTPINPRFDRIYKGYSTYEGQPFFVSEYGGTWWAPGRTDGWGYGNAPKTEEEVGERYEGLTVALLDNPNICAFCYTQLTDIEQEQNGVYRYDRTRKFADGIYEQIRRANMHTAAYEKE
ncbi:MAG: glycoside hydrolase family 2 TIM barrel-domain containing protein [Clostridiaceae bacterium]|nr:glycoside hydrolase family 2 TIM barrel-domain containing protein [Clostridiaceae bacterium]